MNFLKPTTFIKQAILFLSLLHVSHFAFSQQIDSTKSVNNFSGYINVTNNGISLLPNLSLNKPAAIFGLTIGKKLTFEPELRFSLEGKPWTFLFWWRYKLLKTDKFSFNIGAHPALSFSSNSYITTDGGSHDFTVVRRYLASEFAPNYLVSKDISVGVYYLYSRGIESEATQNTHFISIRSNFSNIKLSDEFNLRFSPQVYYLNLDAKEGFYVSSTLTLAKKNFPISISSIMSKVINTEIAGKDFVWNISLVYSFSNKYKKI